MRIEKLVAGGAGLGRLQGEVVLVSGVAPEEKVAVEIDRTRKPARGRVLSVLEASASRVEPPCPHVVGGRRGVECGGCDWMHLREDAQRRGKLAILAAALPESLRDRPIEWHRATPAQSRTRARWHARSVGARVVLGYRAASSSTIVEIDACHALDRRLDAAFVDARALLEGAKGEGEVHASLGQDGRPVLAIEWSGELAPAAFRQAEERVRAGRLAGVEIAIEGARQPAVIGDPRPMSRASDGQPVFAPARGFSQASETGDAVLVSLVVERAACEGKKVLELFAGSGNLTVALASRAASVSAVEVSRAACEEARKNVALRGLQDRVRVVEADAEAFPVRNAINAMEVVVLDPPRAGARGACEAIAASKARRCVYVSCDPATLGRDLAKLLAAGFVVTALDAVDLFPDTSHVESVVTLERPR